MSAELLGSGQSDLIEGGEEGGRKADPIDFMKPIHVQLTHKT